MWKIILLALFVDYNSGFYDISPINSILNDFFITRNYTTIQISYSNENRDYANEIMKENSNISFTSLNWIKEIPNLIILNDFNEFSEKIFENNPKYVLMVISKHLSDAERILSTFWRNSMIDVNFLHKFSLYSFNPFINSSCGSKLSLNLINIYNSRNKSWINDNFYPKKSLNLHHCKLNVAINLNIPFTITQTHSNGTVTFDGIEVFLIRELSRDLQFSVNFTVSYANSGFIFDNGTSTGAISTVFKRKDDLIIGKLSHQLDRIKFLTATTFFASSPVVIVIPPTLEISPFVKLYLPFHLTLWIMIISVYIIGCLIIILTYFFKRKFYSLIVGENVNYPLLNIVIVAVGNTQHSLPNRNFSRILLIQFVIFCLIVRSIYQGRLFNILRREIHQKEATTIDELFERNFMFYTYETLSERIHGMRFEKK